MSAATLASLSPFTSAEALLSDRIRSGLPVRLGDGELPDTADDTRTVRAELLRLLLLGGTDVPEMHPRGLRLTGAHIVGQLDLQNARIGSDVQLVNCLFGEALILQSAAFDSRRGGWKRVAISMCAVPASLARWTCAARASAARSCWTAARSPHWTT
jgi:hypothetical protein